MDKQAITKAATVLAEEIANIGYPVGMGLPPHPETCKRIAEMMAGALCEDDGE